MTPTRIPLRSPTRHERFQAWCERHPIVVLALLLAVTTLMWLGIFCLLERR